MEDFLVLEQNSWKIKLCNQLRTGDENDDREKGIEENI